MKPCPRCNHEVQEDQTACPECGVVFAQWDAAHSSSPTLVSPTVPATGRFTPRHQKYLGLVLVILSWVLSILNVRNGVPTFFWIFWMGFLTSGVGLALYAKGSGRSWAWGSLALLPFLGPLFGLLACAKNKKIESNTDDATLPTSTRSTSSSLTLAWIVFAFGLYASAKSVAFAVEMFYGGPWLDPGFAHFMGVFAVLFGAAVLWAGIHMLSIGFAARRTRTAPN